MVDRDHAASASTSLYVRVASVLAMAVIIANALAPRSTAPALAAGDAGYRDFSYSGASAPTGQKPQSKLWHNDGIWWGSLYNRSTARYEVYRFNWATQAWSTTGVVIDQRRKSSADALWDGTHLYIASAVPPGTGGDTSIYVVRYSYNSGSKAYSTDPGFPVAISSLEVETVVLDKDTTGKLWVTYTMDNGQGGRKVHVMHTTSNDLTWGQPYVPPVAGAANLKSDDISAVVAFNGQIGVMWSNQNDNAVYFAIHRDGDPDSAWSLSPALQGPKYADDHINLKSLQADPDGQVFAAVKTSLNDVSSPPDAPLILLLTLDQHGSWKRRTFGTVADDHTRPIVLLDRQNRQVYVFATVPVGSATSGAIYYKQVSLSNSSVQFPEGLGTPFMSFSTDNHINNATSTKQALDSTTDLLVIAGDDQTKYYYHNVIDLGPSSGPSATPTGTATPTVTPTATASSPVSTLNFPAVADAYVEQANPDSNFEGINPAQLLVDGSPVRQSYLRFVVSGVTGPVHSARLRLFATNGTGNGPASYLTDNSWDEATITWNGRPGVIGAATDDRGAIGTDTWVEFEVARRPDGSAVVAGDGTYSLALISTSSDGVDFDARVGPRPPELVVSFEAAAPISTATSTSTATAISNTPSPTATATSTPTLTATPTVNVTPTPTPIPSIVTLSPTDDASIYQNSADQNLGSATSLETDNSPVNHFLLKFAVSGVGTRQVTAARLRLYCVSGSDNGGQFHSAGNDWSESTVTWNTAPGAIAPLASLGSVAKGGWYEVDLTNYITGDGVYSLRVTSSSADGADYISSEGSASRVPQLVLTLD